MGIVVANPESVSSETRFADGSTRHVASLETARIGRGVYRPGWRWSRHVGTEAGAVSARHVGHVILGRLGVRGEHGTEALIGPGDAFELGPRHDAWVIGEQPCIALDFAPIERSARP